MGCDWCERPVGASHSVTCPLKGYVTEPAAPSEGGAGDEIAKLRSEIARLREERRWVPVGERLPGDEEWVDVAGRWGDCLGWHDGEEWRNVEEDPFPSEVTHWRKRGPGPEGDG
jgi:hypothetical protein